MNYHEKLSKFFADRNISNLEISEAIGYSPTMVSRYLTKSKPNYDFMMSVNEAFPEIDWNYLLKDDIDSFNEEAEPYLKNPDKIITEIEIKLKSLKFNLAQSSHK